MATEFDEVDPAIRSSVDKLTRDLVRASVTLGRREARFLVDEYYTLQNNRIRADHQKRTLEKSGEPHILISWIGEQSRVLENQLKRALTAYSGAQIPGVWLMSICGIGPVISAGLLCHIDVEIAKTVGQVWRYAGYDPTVKWNKATKRPWNAALKRICFIAGDSFVKQKNHPNSVYAPLYEGRKTWETRLNERGDFAPLAKRALEEKKFDKTTEAYKHYIDGRLPPARIHMRSLRYMVKVFLADYHAIASFHARGLLAPEPYILNRENHVHHIMPPNMDLIPGLREAWVKRANERGRVIVTHAEEGERMARSNRFGVYVDHGDEDDDDEEQGE